MMHSILAAAVYVAMVLAPCAIAWSSPVEDPDSYSESNVFEDGSSDRSLVSRTSSIPFA